MADKVQATDMRNLHDVDLDRRVHDNQERLAADLTGSYDFIVRRAGSSSSDATRLLAEDGTASVLSLEASGDDADVPSVTEAALWPTNLGGERDWASQGSLEVYGVEHLSCRRRVSHAEDHRRKHDGALRGHRRPRGRRNEG
jgi:hypothetical protein